MKKLLICCGLLVFLPLAAGKKNRAAVPRDQEFSGDFMREIDEYNRRVLYNNIIPTVIKEEDAIKRMRFVLSVLQLQRELLLHSENFFACLAQRAHIELRMNRECASVETNGGVYYKDEMNAPESFSLLISFFKYDNDHGMVFTGFSSSREKEAAKALQNHKSIEVQRIVARMLIADERNAALKQENEALKKLEQFLHAYMKISDTIERDKYLKNCSKTLSDFFTIMSFYIQKERENQKSGKASPVDITVNEEIKKLHAQYKASNQLLLIDQLEALIVAVEKKEFIPQAAKKSPKVALSAKKVKQDALFTQAAPCQDYPPVVMPCDEAADAAPIESELEQREASSVISRQLASIIGNEACWHPRVAMWCGDESAQRQAIAVREKIEQRKFSLRECGSLARHHGFDRSVDEYIESLGIIIPWRTEGSFSVNIPGQIVLADGREETGVFSWGVDMHTKTVFHRSFAKKVIREIQEIVQQRRYDANFPPLDADGSYEAVQLAPCQGDVADKGMYIEIFDRRNNMTIRLFKVKKI